VKKILAASTILLLSASGSLVQTSLAVEGVGMDRTVLPIPEPAYPPITTFDARNATPPPRFEAKAPADAPNVLIILLDDMGFGQSSAFGGPIDMPTVDALAREGLRYNEFHTTALCSPTRVALLTGRNHHPNNLGDHRTLHRLSRQYRGAPEQHCDDRPDPAAQRLQYGGLR
jgi:hypothetical protein